MDSEKQPVQKATKKRLLRILLVCGIILLVLLVASVLIDRFYQNNRYKEETKKLDYQFASADYAENIFEDAEYLACIENGFLYFTDAATNVTVGYEREEAEKYGDDLVFMTEYIYAAINGDHEAYNNMFSQRYYEDNTPLERFTMQKIYDVTLTRVSETDQTENGNTFHSYSYIVEYKILDNNGTFRNDIGTGSRKQYVTLTDRDGMLLIDAVGVNRN